MYAPFPANQGQLNLLCRAWFLDLITAPTNLETTIAFFLEAVSGEAPAFGLNECYSDPFKDSLGATFEVLIVGNKTS